MATALQRMEIKVVHRHLICSEHCVTNVFCFDELIWLQKESEGYLLSC